MKPEQKELDPHFDFALAMLDESLKLLRDRKGNIHGASALKLWENISMARAVLIELLKALRSD